MELVQDVWILQDLLKGGEQSCSCLGVRSAHLSYLLPQPMRMQKVDVLAPAQFFVFQDALGAFKGKHCLVFLLLKLKRIHRLV